MPMLKNITLPNGVELSFHKITKLEVYGDLSQVNVQVASWKDEDQYIAGTAPVWNQYILLPFDLTVLDSLTDGLVATGTFSGATLTTDAMDSLETIKLRAWGRMKSKRDSLEYGPVTYEGNQYDADPDSQRRIIGACVLTLMSQMYWVTGAVEALAAAAGVTLPEQPTQGQEWTDYTNVPRDLSLQDIQGLGYALAVQAGTVHTIARGLRTAIEGAENAEEVDSVTWPTT